MVTIVIAVVTLIFQFSDPAYREGVIGAALWFLAVIAYFAPVGWHRLVRSTEEEFAMRQAEARR